jgi:hypothetical protein
MSPARPLLVVALWVSACSTEPPLPELSTCSAGWQPVVTGQAGIVAPSAMILHGDRLYYSRTGGKDRIESLSIDGGVPAELGDGWADDFWVEGDQLLYARLEELYTRPLAGGPEVKLLAAGIPDTAVNDLHARAYALDARFFYLVPQRFGKAPALWRMPRAGGPAEKLADLPGGNIARELILGDGVAVIIFGDQISATAVPLSGGAPRDLAMPSRFRVVGTDGRVILWSKFVREHEDREWFELWSSPVAGDAPRRRWPGMPAEFLPTQGWPDGHGGWTFVVLERFSDGELHRSVWTLDANDRATRHACDPDPNGPFPVAGALGASTLYLSLQQRDRFDQGWSIIKVPSPN